MWTSMVAGKETVLEVVSAFTVSEEKEADTTCSKGSA